MDRSNKNIEQLLRLRNILEKIEENKRNRMIIVRLSYGQMTRYSHVACAHMKTPIKLFIYYVLYI